MGKDHCFAEPTIMLLSWITKKESQNMLLRTGSISLQVIISNANMIQGLLPFSPEYGAIRATTSKFTRNGAGLRELRYRLQTSQEERRSLRNHVLARI